MTLPFDPSAFPSGTTPSNLVLLHFNTSTNTWEQAGSISVDTSTHTITGTLSSLSPVTVGIESPSSSSSGGGSGGGGGGGGGGSSSGAIDLTPTLPDSFFVNNPLAKIQVSSVGPVSAQGTSLLSVNMGQQVSIKTTFKNFQQTSQSYAVVVMITDKDGYTTNISWQTGTLESGKSTTVSTSWSPEESGAHNIKVFVWDKVSGSPTALSAGGSSIVGVS